jgi:Preprotein translocase subunit SecB.
MGESVLMSDAPVNANEVEQYSRVVKAVELDEIRLLKVVAECTPGTQPQAIDVETSFRLDKVVDVASGRLEAQAHLLVSGKTAASEEPMLRVELSWLVRYRLPQGFSTSDETGQSFLDRNVPVNIWPYAREFVSELTARMGFLPPLVLPVLKILR